MDKLKKQWTLIILAIGFLVVFEAINIYNNANMVPNAQPSFCHISDLIDCDGVAQTKYAVFLGIPLALWGLFLYMFILFLALIDEIKTTPGLGFLKVFKNPSSYIHSLALLSFSISMVLAGIQIFDIQKLCIICFLTYAVDLALLLVNKSWGKGPLYDVKVSIQDFIEAIKVKNYAISFFAIVFLGVCVLAYTSLSYVLAQQVKRQNEFEKIKSLNAGDFPVYGNVLGDENAKLVAIEFSDFQCPFCSLYNTVLYKVIKKDGLKNVRIEHKNFPLDSTCNKYLSQTMHPQACMLAKYAIAAEKQGKHWDVVTILFDEKPTTETKIKELAVNLDIDIDKLQKDAHSPEVKKQLEDEIEEAIKYGVNGTPALVVNGKAETGMKLDYEVEELLLKNGATKE